MAQKFTRKKNINFIVFVDSSVHTKGTFQTKSRLGKGRSWDGEGSWGVEGFSEEISKDFHVAIFHLNFPPIKSQSNKKGKIILLGFENLINLFSKLWTSMERGAENVERNTKNYKLPSVWSFVLSWKNNNPSAAGFCCWTKTYFRLLFDTFVCFVFPCAAVAWSKVADMEAEETRIW